MVEKNKMGMVRPRLLLTLLLFIIVPDISLAASSKDDAKVFVEELSDKVLKIVKSKNNSEEDKEKWLTDIFRKSVDSRWMGRFVLGRYFRKATPAQQKRYLKLYTKFLINSYVPRFKTYAGGDFKILGVIPKGDEQYIIQTELTSDSKESPALRVDYRLKNRDNKFYVIDIVGEGISLLTTQRSDFSGLISRKGIPYFLDKLEEKVKKLKVATK
jgi:phospholipid transport system substrate-binding protein